MAVHYASGFSTAVRLKLVIEDIVLRVCQVGSTSLILRDIKTFAPNTKATIIISVDGEEQFYPVNLHEGIQGEFVTFENLPVAEASPF